MLVTYSTFAAQPAHAHGVVASAELTADGAPVGTAQLEFTDETGDICFTIDVDDATPSAAVVRPTDSPETVADLDIAATGLEGCTRVPVDAVETILADVDAFVLVVEFDGGDDASGVLRKPLPPGFENVDAVAPTEAGEPTDGGVDRGTVLAFGALGVAAAMAVTWGRRSVRRRRT